MIALQKPTHIFFFNEIYKHYGVYFEKYSLTTIDKLTTNNCCIFCAENVIDISLVPHSSNIEQLPHTVINFKITNHN